MVNNNPTQNNLSSGNFHETNSTRLSYPSNSSPSNINNNNPTQNNLSSGNVHEINSTELSYSPLNNNNNYTDVMNAAMIDNTIPTFTPTTTSGNVTNLGHNYRQSSNAMMPINDNNYDDAIYAPANPVTSSENDTNLQSTPLNQQNQQNQPQQPIVPPPNTLNTITINSPTNLFGCKITISITNQFQ